ncbi:MAG: ABC transporter permease [Bacteroidales bacterium]|nr:ABC transporter permease [Bacteroidales bacterium]
MKFETLITRRFLQKQQGGFSTSLVRIATWSVALGVLVMIMSVAILRGFQNEIRQKVVGFGSHIIIKSQFIGNGYDEIPISTLRPELQEIGQLDGVKHIQFFAEKGGMIKTDDQIQGVIFKGVDQQFDSTFFSSCMQEGRLFNLQDSTASNEVVISRTLANKLHLSLDDKLRTYFWQENSYRARAFKVVGIYNTDLTDFDNHYMIGDLRQIQRLNGWDDTLVAGYEVLIDDFSKLDRLGYEVASACDYDLIVTTIRQMNPALFAWLDLLNSNIALILAVMAVVCVVAVISALLIMIFEKTSMIGILKTLGANNTSIRSIFLRKSAEIVGRGLLFGNALALTLCLLQSKLHLIHLDSESYYMPYVPIDLNPWMFLLISAGTLAVCILALLIPATYIAKIDPAKTIRVE